MGNLTPLQKSIAEIEAEIKFQKKVLEQGTIEKHERTIKLGVFIGLRDAIQILTANLEYERDVMIKDWIHWHTVGRKDGEDRCTDSEIKSQIGYDMGNYYTKTYNNEPKN